MLLQEDNYWHLAIPIGYERALISVVVYHNELHQYEYKHRDVVVTPAESTKRGRLFTVHRFDVIMKFVVYFTLLTSAVHAGVLRKKQSCPQVCDASQCPVLAHACYYEQLKDRCGCCVVCAAGEGETCGPIPCGDGLRCDPVREKHGGLHSTCVCASSGPVCGSDGRTYPSICRLKAENRRAELGEIPPVIFIQRGWCESGEWCDLFCTIEYRNLS